jgi:hypothetical protein
MLNGDSCRFVEDAKTSLTGIGALNWCATHRSDFRADCLHVILEGSGIAYRRFADLPSARSAPYEGRNASDREFHSAGG